MKNLRPYLLKSKFGITSLGFVLIFCVVISCLFCFCNKQEENNVLIENIDVENMAKLHLSDFFMIRERPDSLGTEYVFKREDDSVTIFITIGLFPSLAEVENAASEYLNVISLYMENGLEQEISIGEKYLWWAPNQDFSKLTNLVFVRKNGLFILSSHSFGDLKTLAKTIDDDILREESYITFEK